jgi:hypothetical protein
MKLLFPVICCILFSFHSYSQDTLASAKGQLTDIVRVESVSKEDLYNRAKIWFARNFKSSKDVIQLEDRELGKIIGKGNIPYEASAFWPGTNFSGYFEFMLTIEIKDGRYRYFVEDLKHVSYKNGCSGGNLSQEKPLGSTFLGTAPNKKGWQKIKNDGYESVSLLIKSLTEEMNKSTPKDDW